MEWIYELLSFTSTHTSPVLHNCGLCNCSVTGPDAEVKVPASLFALAPAVVHRRQLSERCPAGPGSVPCPLQGTGGDGSLGHRHPLGTLPSSVPGEEGPHLHPHGGHPVSPHSPGAAALLQGQTHGDMGKAELPRGALLRAAELLPSAARPLLLPAAPWDQLWDPEFHHVTLKCHRWMEPGTGVRPGTKRASFVQGKSHAN